MVENVCRTMFVSALKNFAVNNVSSMLMCVLRRRLTSTVRTVARAIMMHFVVSCHVRKVLNSPARQPLNMFASMKRDISHHQPFHDAISVSVILLSHAFFSHSTNNIDYVLLKYDFSKGNLIHLTILSLALNNIFPLISDSVCDTE